MNNKKIYIILFAILYLCVALVSTIHAISFFGLANASPLAIILAIAFEVGQAAVLFSILTDSNQQKRVMPWVLMSILTLVQVMGNVYNSYRYLILNSEDGLRFFKEPIFVWTQIPDNVANVILSYIIGAILPIVSLLMTAMVTGFLNKKEEVKNVEVKDEPKIEEQKEEQPKITIDEETGGVKINDKFQTPPNKEFWIPIRKNKEEKKDPGEIEENEVIIPKEIIDDKPYPTSEEIKKIISEGMGTDSGKEVGSSIIGKEGEDGMKIIEEDKQAVQEENDKEEIKEEDKQDENEQAFPHEIVNEESKKSHFINL